MRNRLLSFCLLLSLLLVAASCKETRKYKIGVSQCSQDDWRTKMNDEIYREILLHDDALVEIRSADDSNAKQIADIRYFADHGFDILIVSPNEAAALTPIIKEVYGRGMPVVIFDRNIEGDTYTARIGVDDVGLGRSAARYASHLLGRGGKAIEIYGRPGSTPAEGRHEGFVSEFTRQGGRLLASVPANWNKEDAMPVADSLLEAHEDVDLIYAHNDRMAIGAAEVARRRGRSDIRIIGIDAAPDIGIRAVADSVIDATFLYPTEGHRLVKTALAILKGEPYQRETVLPVSSAVDLSNADILLLQNETLKEETRKILLLKGRMDDYWAQHSAQTVLFYACVAIIVLLSGVGFLLLRSYWQHRRHQRELTAKNRLLEEQRDKQERLNEQLRQATQSKLMFFTNVSHDLRTPLTLIAEPVAQLAAADNLTQQQAVMMKLANKNVKIIRRLIDQILDFRKYENGKLELRLSEGDFGAALRDWTESFAGVARRRGIKLTLKPPSEGDGGVMMAFDSGRMERVVFNLLANAFKFTPDGGEITVAYEAGGGQLTFSVADTGEGIGERDLGNIFDRFVQAERVHATGSGIGLSVAKAFVELHGGRISVESRLNRGSKFTVTLPVRHVAEAAATSALPAGSSGAADELEPVDDRPAFDEGKPLVLVADDNRDMQTLVGELLGGDYNIIRAENGKVAVRLAAKYVPDLIVCDVMMPVMDGLACLKHIKGELTTSHIPVLMLTACSTDEQRAEGYAGGADGYLSKPFDSGVLRARCASLIANRKRVKELWQPADGAVRTPVARSPKAQAGDIDSEFYLRFLEVFRREMGNQNLSVDMLASSMGLERSQFYRKIKSLTNYAPVELIRRLRLQQGRDLLLQTEKSVGEIAYEIGFSSPAYFTKCYRDAYGETPSQVRNGLVS